MIAAMTVTIFSCKNDKATETNTDEVNKTVKEVASEKLTTILTDENFGLKLREGLSTCI